MNTFRMMLLGTVAAGLTAAAVAPASAGEVEKSVTLAGQVSRTVAVVDEGVSTTVISTDNDQSSSRLKITGQAKSETLTTKAYVEFNVVGNEHKAQNSGNNTTLAMRQSYVSLANEMGTLVVGYATSAANSAVGSNFSGVSNGSFWSDPVLAGLLHATDNATLGWEENSASLSSISTSTGDNNYKVGRTNTVKYISPNFSGFSVQASANEGATDSTGSSLSGGLYYSADYDGTKVKAAIAGSNFAASSTTLDSQITGTIGVELANGLNASFGAGTNNRTDSSTVDDAEGWTVMVGYDANMIDAGETSFNVFYEENDDMSADGDEHSSVAIQVEQDLSDYGTSISAGIQQFEYSTTAVKYEDITAGWVGIRVNF